MSVSPKKAYQYFRKYYGILKPSPKGWYAFDCPFCGGRKKRAVHLQYGITKCWTCDYRGRILDFIQLHRDISYGQARQEILSTIESELDFHLVEQIVTKSKISDVQLPEGYVGILDGDGVLGKRARKYLTKRGFNLELLDAKGFGYCTKHGKNPDGSGDDINYDFFGYIIIPFKRDGQLVWYQGRDFLGNQYLRYKNPPLDYVGVGKSDVLYNEEALYMYDEVSISEGWADGETWGDDGIATNGWSFSDYQMDACIKSTVKRFVFIPDAGLDNSGVSFYKKAVRAATHFFSSGKEIYVLNLNTIASGDKKDTNAIGREAVLNLYAETKPLTKANAMRILTDKVTL